jgi:hypothetical protein
VGVSVLKDAQMNTKSVYSNVASDVPLVEFCIFENRLAIRINRIAFSAKRHATIATREYTTIMDYYNDVAGSAALERGESSINAYQHGDFYYAFADGGQ